MEQIRDEHDPAPSPFREHHRHDVWERVTELASLFRAPSGDEYVVTIEGAERTDGTWSGRIAFVRRGDLRVTGQETSQPTRDALIYWATGLEPVYLDGAFLRAA